MENKLSANEVILRLINAINYDNKSSFYKVIEEYKDSLVLGGSVQSKINYALRNRPLKMIALDNLSNDIKKLIQSSIITEDNVYLPDFVKEIIDRLLLEWENRDALRFHNLPIRNKILFHGETGNGKTTIARHIAKLSNLPFVEINADVMIDSKLGNSGQNINRIFNEIKEPCILFWDEIDSIGRKRASIDSSAGQENERMVNSILVNIDKLNNDVIFIGATNRKDVLDSAFLRRFDIELELPAPSIEQKEAFFYQMTEYYKLDNATAMWHSEICNEAKNYSEIKSKLIEVARKQILSKLLK